VALKKLTILMTGMPRNPFKTSSVEDDEFLQTMVDRVLRVNYDV
jgi:hypothetical protein